MSGRPSTTLRCHASNTSAVTWLHWSGIHIFQHGTLWRCDPVLTTLKNSSRLCSTVGNSLGAGIGKLVFLQLCDTLLPDTHNQTLEDQFATSCLLKEDRTNCCYWFNCRIEKESNIFSWPSLHQPNLHGYILVNYYSNYWLWNMNLFALFCFLQASLSSVSLKYIYMNTMADYSTIC